MKIDIKSLRQEVEIPEKHHRIRHGLVYDFKETTCGKPHNNAEGDETCLECQIIIKNL